MLFLDAFYLLLILLPMISILGAALALELALPKVKFPILFSTVPILFLVPFFIEHFIGLGRPTWLFAPIIFGSLYLIQRRGWSLLREPVLWYFLATFLFCLLWRCERPDLDGYTERLADLSFVNNCSRGDCLPPNDLWLRGQKMDSYYYLQYYIVAWLNRAMMVPTGVCCNLGVCFAIGFGGAAVAVAIKQLTSSIYAGSIALLHILYGASGVALVIPFCFTKYDYWTAFHFIGVYFKASNPDLNDTGRELMATIGSSTPLAPMEFFAHTVILGDFHSSLSSLYLLGLLLISICYTESEPFQSPNDRFLAGLAVALLPLAIVMNCWVLPLLGIILCAWFIYRRFQKKPDDLRELFIAGALPFLLIFPYFSHFAIGSQTYHNAIDASYIPIPYSNWFLTMFPGMVMILLNAQRSFPVKWRAVLLALVAIYVVFRLFHGSDTSGRLIHYTDLFTLGMVIITLIAGMMQPGLIRFFIPTSVALFLFSRFIHMDDYLGPYINTSIKWWPWAYAFAVVLGFGLAWRHIIVRSAAIVLVVLTVVPYAYVVGLPVRLNWGGLEGCHYVRANPIENAMLTYLNSLPRGTVLEGVGDQDCAGVPIFQPFTQHYALGGWIDRELVWRGAYRNDLLQLANDRLRFYQNDLPDSRIWLLTHRVDYITWTDPDNARAGSKGLRDWQLINQAISPSYAWHDFGDPGKPIGQYPLGLWVRRTVR